MILAGDIGGTKTVLSLSKKNTDGSLSDLKEQTFASANYPEFDEILNEFLPADAAIESACFGIAGPVINQQCRITNLPWIIDGGTLQQKLGAGQVKLLNDMEAMAIGMLHLPQQDLIELNPNVEYQSGNIAVIAAGTGLGEAILYWDGSKHHPIATEGGHTDLAAQNTQQDKLLAYLRKIFPDHVSCERIIAGGGFGLLYDFLVDDGFAVPSPEVPGSDSGIDRNAIISKLGLAGKNPACAEALRMFIEFYGAEAGNLALKSLATGGIFIGGGIAEKILPALQDGQFIRAMKAKGRFHNLLDKVSVKVAVNARAPLIGAMNYCSY